MLIRKLPLFKGVSPECLQVTVSHQPHCLTRNAIVNVTPTDFLHAIVFCLNPRPATVKRVAAHAPRACRRWSTACSWSESSEASMSCEQVRLNI